MWRRIGAFVAGLAIAFLLVEAAELGVHQLYPAPPGTNMSDMKAVKAYVGTLPPAAFVLVLAGWLVGTVAGTFAATRIARNPAPAYVLGALLLAAGIANAISIPQPLWFSIVSFVIYVAGTIAGARLGSPPLSALPASQPA
ncbi:MAG TPA: hypothetical protein VLV78_05405 [Thermoanaerobaculia bacterium]|nr:hypothetical protein [Thermoanaerobaculia bacterium]